MDSLKKFVAEIQQFFALVESHDSQIQEWINEVRKPLNSIINQSTILRAAIPENSICNTGLERFEGFRGSLIEIIVLSLEEELVYLEDIRNKIDAANRELQKTQESIENLFINLKLKSLINSSELNPCCPALEHIVDWCSDVWCYYHSFYLQISQAIINLNLENEDSVTALFQSFREDSELKKLIRKIRSFNLSKFEFLI